MSDFFENQFQGIPKRTFIELIASTRKIRDKQYPTNAIRAVDFKYSAQNKQLYVKAQATPYSTKGRKSPFALSMVIDRLPIVDNPKNLKNIISYHTDSKNEIYLQKPSFDNTCRVRCQCDDFRFMWSYYDKQNKALIGQVKPYVRKTTTYPERNPTHVPGLCKHLLALIKMLSEGGILSDNYNIISTYLSSRKV